MRDFSKHRLTNRIGRSAAPILLSLAASGCGNGNDPKVPGEALGRFHVSAHIEDSTCGPGALGSTDVWEFDVQLSRRDADLYWLNGEEAIPGRLASDGVSFAFDTRVAIQVAPPGKGSAGCTMLRSDQASGTLERRLGVVGFIGRMRFATRRRPRPVSPLVVVEGGSPPYPATWPYRLERSASATPNIAQRATRAQAPHAPSAGFWGHGPKQNLVGAGRGAAGAQKKPGCGVRWRIRIAGSGEGSAVWARLPVISEGPLRNPLDPRPLPRSPSWITQ